MLTIIESPLFTKLWPDYWSAEEHGDFASHLANDPEAGYLRFLAQVAAARFAGHVLAWANAVGFE